MDIRISDYDDDGKLYVDCAECKRGGNGDKSCGAGSNIKAIRKGMCFLGETLK